MDRLDAMKVFVLAVDEGSLAAAGRELGRSPAAVSRAIAFLEERVGVELLHRTTRSIKLSEEGERYLAICRRVLTELEEADDVAAGPRTAPRGLLTMTAPVVRARWCCDRSSMRFSTPIQRCRQSCCCSTAPSI